MRTYRLLQVIALWMVGSISQLNAAKGVQDLLRHCQFEQPEVLAHYLPVFMADPLANDGHLPVLDLLLDRNGKHRTHSLINFSNYHADQAVMNLLATATVCTPAIACGEPIEGFLRYSPNSYAYLLDPAPEAITAPPYATFVLPDQVFATLKINRFISKEKHLTFDLTISDKGEITKIKGRSKWARYLDDNYIKNLLADRRFSPAKKDGRAVEAKIRWEIPLLPQSSTQAVMDVVQFKKPRKPMPKRPEGIDYKDPKRIRVAVWMSAQGLLQQVQFFDPLETRESVSILNALRNWYLPPEANKTGPRKYRAKLAFTADAPEAELVELTEQSDLSKPPRPTKRVSPVYPRQAKRQGVQGSVEVTFVVDDEGRVAEAVASATSHPVFSQSAVNAVKQWRFDPGELNGRPVSARCRIVLPFMIER